MRENFEEMMSEWMKLMSSDDTQMYTLNEYKDMLSTYKNSPLAKDMDKIVGELEKFIKEYKDEAGSDFESKFKEVKKKQTFIRENSAP